jgi:ribosomal protein S3
LLHYYKSTPLFANHFARELEKVHKKVHWRLIYSLRSLLNNVPSQPAIRRQLHGLLIEMNGRPKGRARTFVFRLREGSLAPQSYFFRISFGMGEALAKVGALGIRIWIVY